MKEALCYILNNIVDNPEKVNVSYEEANGICRFKITAESSERGKIIGKNGKTVKAIRNLFSAIGRKNNKKVFIEIA